MYIKEDANETQDYYDVKIKKEFKSLLCRVYKCNNFSCIMAIIRVD